MPKKALTTLLAIIFFVTGCTSQPPGTASTPSLFSQTDGTLSATSTLSPTLTRQTVSTPSTTPTKPEPASTIPDPTKTTVISTSDTLRYNTLSIADQFPTNIVISGTLVFGAIPGASFLTFGQEKPYHIFKDDQLVLNWNMTGVSPNRKWLAYGKVEDSVTRWILQNASGEEQNRIEIEGNWWLSSWIGNEQILIRRTDLEVAPTDIDNPYTWPAMVLNVFTGERQEIPLDYPGLDEAITYFFINIRVSGMIYDSSLNLVAYPRWEDGCYYVLWDRQAQKTLARVEAQGCTILGDPIWLPDESGFLIAVFHDGSAEWFQVGREGDVHQLTHFKDFSEGAEIGTDGADLSPDGRYLAFSLLVHPGPYPNPRLAVLDLKTFEVTGYGIPESARPDPHLQMAWSPDGRYLAVSSAGGDAILVDIFNQQATRLVDDWPLFGWME